VESELCDQGTYANNKTKECTPCQPSQFASLTHLKCLEKPTQCDSFSAPYNNTNQCVVCPENMYRSTSNDTCVSECPNGSFINGKQCSLYKCARNCISCFSPSASHCLTCKEGTFFLVNGNEESLCVDRCEDYLGYITFSDSDGYIPTPYTCIQCPLNCHNCENA